MKQIRQEWKLDAVLRLIRLNAVGTSRRLSHASDRSCWSITVTSARAAVEILLLSVTMRSPFQK
jgi:hypothetical protein